MSRLTLAALAAGLCVSGMAAAQSQSEPTGSMQPPATESPSASPNKSATGHHDTSRGAKEQQSQKKKCPKNGDQSNVNCKEASDGGQSPPK